VTREMKLRLLSPLLSMALGVLHRTSSFAYMPWSSVVRRQGLEPRTRGLRARDRDRAIADALDVLIVTARSGRA